MAERKQKRILLTVAYDGTGYSGFQAQKSGVPTISSVLAEAVRDLTGEETEIGGASRTDAGVHALCNLAVFDTYSRIPAEKFPRALNVRLPAQIRIVDACHVPDDFHPRFCETVKTYEYRIYNAPYPSPVRRHDTYYSYTPFDVARMKRAAEHLQGEHDFKSFCSAHAQVSSTVREITEITVEESACEQESGALRVLDGVRHLCDGAGAVNMVSGTDSPLHEKHGDVSARESSAPLTPRLIVIRVSGKGFLYNMVRIIAGTLMEAGRGMIEPEDIPRILQMRDRSAAGPTAPPEGLTLTAYEIAAASIATSAAKT